MSRFLPLRPALLWIAWLLASSGASAAMSLESEYSVRLWHQRDGLAGEDVYDLAQDSRGFLWVVCADQLLRFDGTRFQKRPEAPQASLGGPRKLAATPEGGMFCTSDQRGLIRILKGKDAGEILPPELQERRLIQIFAAPDALWAGSADGTIFRWANGKMETFAGPRGLPGPRRIGFATDGAGRVWVSSDLTLLRYENGVLREQPLPRSGEELQICSSRGDGPWVVTETQLLVCRGGEFQALLSIPPLLGAHYVQAMLEDHRGGLWLGTRSQGLQLLRADSLRAFGGLSDEILSLGEDREGNIWVGMSGGGLAQLRTRTYQVFDKSSGLLVDHSATVCEDTSGAVWLANRDGGVLRLDSPLPKPVGPLPDWPSYSAVSVFPWGESVGFTCGSGAYLVGPEPARAVSHLSEIPSPPIVRVTYRARNGDVWMSLPPERVARLSSAGVQLYTRADGLTGSEIRAFGEDGTDSLLVGTADGELLRWDGHSSFQRFSILPHQPTGAIQAILGDPDGQLWLGTERNGLLTSGPHGTGAWDARRGLLQNNLSQIAGDDRGNLWFGSPAGVFRLSRADLLSSIQTPGTRLQPVLVGQDSAHPPFSCLAQYQPGVVKTRDGRLWFATRRGVLVIDPALETASPQPPRVEIDAVVADQDLLLSGNSVSLRSGAPRLEFHFSTLCLSTPERLHTRYRLSGFDPDWRDSPSSGTASYARLPAGDYRFEVSSVLPDSPAASAAVATVAVHVAARLFERPWFQLAALLTLLAAVAQTVRVVSNRRLRLRLERAERERTLEQERARIARDIHDDLGASLSRISLLSQAARTEVAPADDKRLSDIYETVSQITRSMDEIVWAVDPKHDDLDGLASYLASYAQQFLSAAEIRCRLDVPDHLPALRLGSQPRHHLFLCLKEALNNVVRHAQASIVNVTMNVQDDTFTLTITDNGRGFPSALAQPSSDRSHSGNGLLNMRERMAAVGGQCAIAPAMPNGTEVIFSLPVARVSEDVLSK